MGSLLQEFDMEIIDRKGTENKVTDHLSRLENPEVDRIQLVVNASFPNEQLLKIEELPWIAYKTPIGISPYALVFGKACHLPLELKYKAMWAVQKLNFDLKAAGEEIKLQLLELDEWRLQAYENFKIYKECTK
ncbi:uncharacterized protein LOC120090566 [Benincasa hispida]|uniref:uncharacterized protein LOC120090566 n=1 Tax=Benincasa hispida TaxID=102211 RepID=UPI00190117E7|nr:uncharacterized protein LOC120090566 [Benincasa hispida]